MTRTMVLSDCGHCSGAPKVWEAQSRDRRRAPVSPPPVKKAREEELAGSTLTVLNLDLNGADGG